MTAIVAITHVNLDSNTYAGYHPQIGTFEIKSMVQPGGHITIPSVGEQWIVERLGNSWFLKSKTDWNDSRVTDFPNEEGMDVLGSGNGPTYLTGARVVLPQTVWLSGVEIRVNPDTYRIQYKDASGWVDMTGGSGGGGGSVPVTAPTRVSYVQTLTTRATGANQIIEGVRPGPCVLTEVTYEFGTADASGTTTVELRLNGTTLSGSTKAVSAANQASGTSTEAARTATGSWTIGKSDSLTVYTTAVGTTPGSRLTAHCFGTVALS